MAELPSEDQPPEGEMSLAQSAVAMHELFTNYMEAGFTERQAMELLVAVITHNQGD